MLDLSALFRSQGTRAFVTHYQEPSRRVPSTHEVDYRNVCPAKTSSSRLAGRKSWGFKLFDHIIVRIASDKARWVVCKCATLALATNPRGRQPRPQLQEF